MPLSSRLQTDYLQINACRLNLPGMKWIWKFGIQKCGLPGQHFTLQHLQFGVNTKMYK
jgi:hypothetical protein